MLHYEVGAAGQVHGFSKCGFHLFGDSGNYQKWESRYCSKKRYRFYQAQYAGYNFFVSLNMVLSFHHHAVERSISAGHEYAGFVLFVA